MTGEQNQRAEYIVSFNGELVKCLSIEDAVALKAAQRLLDNPFENDMFPAEIDRVTRVVRRFGKEDLADRLSSISSRMRAGEVLAASGA